ncbi:MAG TPA: ankyrin repeat domain-containing protein [Candidatus Dependentiae bacterium]|nr:ankyrin repeat domain-containing protein [Candidatus Dependentiae bacterium]
MKSVARIILNILILSFLAIHGEIVCSTPLHAAVENGQLQLVKDLLDFGTDVNVKDSFGVTPLHIAARINHIEIAQLLLRMGANTEVTDQDGCTPLLIAICARHIEMIKLLIVSGADVDFKCKYYGYTPLHCAAFGGWADVAKILIDAHANIDAVSDDYMTPLYVAIKKAQPEIVQVLIQAGADLTGKYCEGIRAIDLAIDENIAKYISTAMGSTHSVFNSTDIPPLHRAVDNERMDEIKALIANGANIDAQDYSKMTPLHLAAFNGYADVVKLLIDLGANIESRDGTNCTPLHVAASSGHLETVKILIDAHARVDARNINKETPLHVACMENADVVKTLINAGANINAHADDNFTPLHYAARFFNSDSIQVLLDAGADIEAETIKKFTPLHTVANYVLIEGIVRDEVIERRRFEQKRAARTLISAGANLQARDELNRTPLHIAAYAGSTYMVETFLDAGSDLEALSSSWYLRLCSKVGFQS